jgi:hypothetical protein
MNFVFIFGLLLVRNQKKRTRVLLKARVREMERILNEIARMEIVIEDSHLAGMTSLAHFSSSVVAPSSIQSIS